MNDAPPANYGLLIQLSPNVSNLLQIFFNFGGLGPYFVYRKCFVNGGVQTWTSWKKIQTEDVS